MTFFYAKNDEKFGPISIEELKEAGINGDTLVWREGFDSWRKASNIAELADLFKTVPPPLPNEKLIPPPLPQNEQKENGSKFLNSDKNTSPKSDDGERKARMIGIGLVATAMIVIIFLILKNSLSNNNTSYNPVNFADTTASVSNTTSNQQSYAQQEENKRLQQQEQTIRQAKQQALIDLRNKFALNVRTEAHYDWRELGGIYNAYVTVYNDNSYLIDNISIYVSYIKRNGYAHKTEDVIVKNVPANGNIMVPVPSSDRGTSVVANIALIQVNSIQLCYINAFHVDFKGRQGMDSIDPFKCQ